eukprot:GHVU01202430.1.p1 GENE.GHVU01202430.1~~GHVU01202430.1.p1  ORF type:complete len:247 (+),score=18.41 GHVU01202430.1:3189-3929(+)
MRLLVLRSLIPCAAPTPIRWYPVTSAEQPNEWVKKLLGDFIFFEPFDTRRRKELTEFRIPTHEDMKMTPAIHQLFGKFVIRVFWYIFGKKCSGDSGERDSLLRADVTYNEGWNFNEIPIQSTQTELLHLQRLAFVKGSSSNILRFRLLYYADPLARLSVDTRQVLGHVLTVMQVSKMRKHEATVTTVAKTIEDVTNTDRVVLEAKKCLRQITRPGGSDDEDQTHKHGRPPGSDIVSGGPQSKKMRI